MKRKPANLSFGADRHPNDVATIATMKKREAELFTRISELEDELASVRANMPAHYKKIVADLKAGFAKTVKQIKQDRLNEQDELSEFRGAIIELYQKYTNAP